VRRSELYGLLSSPPTQCFGVWFRASSVAQKSVSTLRARRPYEPDWSKTVSTMSRLRIGLGVFCLTLSTCLGLGLADASTGLSHAQDGAVCCWRPKGWCL